MYKLSIISSTPKDFKLSSASIRAFEYGPQHFFSRRVPSHLAIVLENSRVYEASYGMVHPRKYENFVDNNHIFNKFDIEISESKLTEIEDWLWSHLGKEYGYYQLFLIMLKLNKEGDDDKFICTELVGRLVEEKLNFNISKGLDTLGIRDCIEILKGLENAKY